MPHKIDPRRTIRRVSKRGVVGEGRPSSYKPEYCAALVEHLKQGLTFETFASTIGVCRDTLSEWAKAHPAFSAAKKNGIEHSLAWWFKVGQAGMTGKIKGFNAAVWIFSMKNLHKWTDKTEFDLNSQQPITIQFVKSDEGDKDAD